MTPLRFQAKEENTRYRSPASIRSNKRQEIETLTSDRAPPHDLTILHTKCLPVYKDLLVPRDKIRPIKLSDIIVDLFKSYNKKNVLAIKFSKAHHKNNIRGS